MGSEALFCVTVYLHIERKKDSERESGCHLILIPEFKREKQEGLRKFEASLIYIENSRPARAKKK